MFRKSKSGTVFAYELYRNGFLETSEYFSNGLALPCLCDVLKRNDSYRMVKRKVRSYERYRDFVPTYTYPLGRVRFLRVMAAFLLALL